MKQEHCIEYYSDLMNEKINSNRLELEGSCSRDDASTLLYSNSLLREKMKLLEATNLDKSTYSVQIQPTASDGCGVGETYPLNSLENVVKQAVNLFDKLNDDIGTIDKISVKLVLEKPYLQIPIPQKIIQKYL